MEMTTARDVKQRKKGIRSLVHPEEPPKPNIAKKYLRIICLLILTGSFVFMVFKNGHIFVELKHLSMNQYQLYLYGRLNYCDESFVYENISTALRNRIVGQDNVIDKIQQILRTHETFTAIALYGAQGVGKTLTLNVIRENFQWHSNVQQYVWSLVHSKQSQLKSLLNIVDSLTLCGQNAIFIDNIPLNSVSIIEEFHQKLLQVCKQNHFGAFAVYVFNNNDDPDQHPTLQFENVSTIYFQNLSLNNLRKCIEIESRLLDVNLDEEQMNEIIASVDLERSGCKHVAAKVALYTRKESGEL